MSAVGKRSQLGNAIVEFALVLPVLALITVGIVDVGRYAYYSIVVANAARAGAAYGSQNEGTAADTAGIQAAETADAQGYTISTPAPSIVCKDPTTLDVVDCASQSLGGNVVEWVQTTVSGSMTPLISYPFVPGTVHVSSTATMRVQCKC